MKKLLLIFLVLNLALFSSSCDFFSPDYYDDEYDTYVILDEDITFRINAVRASRGRFGVDEIDIVEGRIYNYSDDITIKAKIYYGNYRIPVSDLAMQLEDSIINSYYGDSYIYGVDLSDTRVDVYKRNSREATAVITLFADRDYKFLNYDGSLSYRKEIYVRLKSYNSHLGQDHIFVDRDDYQPLVETGL